MSLPIFNWNLSAPELYEEAFHRGNTVSSTGSLIVTTGKYMGRVPHAKRIVKDSATETINWDGLNIPITPELFRFYQAASLDYLGGVTDYYTVDAYAGWSSTYRVGVRIYTTQPEHALFSQNMLIPSDTKLTTPDVTIYDLGHLTLSELGEANATIADPDLTDALVALDLDQGVIVIAGTRYAGEIKKSVFSYMMYKMPLYNCLPLHSSANTNLDGDNPTLFFGLSGTGKTTLSADTGRVLIGDDEHVWHPQGVFNIEGGCYAKCINLDPQKEPEIFQAIKFGSVSENVVYCSRGEADYTDVSLTENTRVSYPLGHVNATLPANTNRHPTSIIFLTCDVTGVIPPISLLTEKQAMTCFLLGYTSKVPGTEVSVREPEVAFSACFGEPFLVWKPERYGELLLQYLRQYPAKVWLLNTGWMGGPATAVQRADGLPRRVPIIDSRRMVRYIQSIGEAEVPTQIYSDFKWQVPTVIPGLGNPDILLPSQVWDDPVKCNQETSKLYRNFQQALHNKFGQDTVDKYWFGIDT